MANNDKQSWLRNWLAHNRLGEDYLASAQHWFDPLARTLAQYSADASRPVLIAVNGSQGSGKSTLCDYLQQVLERQYGLRAITLSLDDFYHTRLMRQQLSQTTHTLFAIRGVPGTHDFNLLNATLDGLLKGGGKDRIVEIPRFDKALDDRCPDSDREHMQSPLDIVLLEGWCLGALPQAPEALLEPLNTLERTEDLGGAWRTQVNGFLAREFVPLYQRVDQWVMLQAPSFDCVYQWRLQQEKKLALTLTEGAGTQVMNEGDVARFIQHYQRLTEHCLGSLPSQVDHLYTLDEARQILSYKNQRLD
ncbi:MAG: hypothetical protein HOC23_13755 [Halieaceae bacterium]|jgi:D-glycerate 3-kinase|nr:hypothetical protein [Halieaceae bacterium]